ncbi:hypothetical protein ACED64_21365, partial [Vibrio splendidus]
PKGDDKIKGDDQIKGSDEVEVIPPKTPPTSGVKPSDKIPSNPPKGDDKIKGDDQIKGSDEAEVLPPVVTPPASRIKVSNNNDYINIELSTTEFNQWNSVSVNDPKSGHVEAITKEIYNDFNDSFDFIIFIVNNERPPQGMPFGEFAFVQNDIKGVGLSNFDNTKEYSSAAKLQGLYALYGSMNKTGVLKAMHLDASLHELFHRWGNWIVTQGSSSHWDDVKGALTNESQFAGIELYLMGLIDKPSAANTQYWDLESETVFNTWTRDSKFEDRMPTPLSSQKNFRGLVVLLTEEGVPIDIKYQNALSANITNFTRTDGMHKKYGNVESRNFWSASKELATFELDNLLSIKK